MIVDQKRGLLYSTGKDRIIHCQRLQQNQFEIAGTVKTSNARPCALEIDTDLQRLYVATREGMVIIFDVKDQKQSVMIHAVRIHKPSKRSVDSVDYIKQMDLDTDRNTLICRSKLGQISVVTIINRSIMQSQIIETINSYKDSPNPDS